MANHVPKQHWRGVSSQEIGATRQYPRTAVQIDAIIAPVLQRMEDTAR